MEGRLGFVGLGEVGGLVAKMEPEPADLLKAGQWGEPEQVKVNPLAEPEFLVRPPDS